MPTRIPKEVSKAFKDANDCDLPGEHGWDKVKCVLSNGARIRWYGQDDLDYWKECGEKGDPRDCAHFSGIVFAIPGIELRSPNEDMDYDQCIVCIDQYGCEKCYPITEWVAMSKLLDDPTVIEVF